MQIAIVTGGSSGIGRSAAMQMAAAGIGVIVTYSSHPDRGEETARLIEEAGGSAVALPLEVGRSETFPGFRDRVVETLSTKWNATGFDILVNNAGFGQMSLFPDTSEELFDEFNRVLFRGPYFLTQTLLPLMAEGGSIITISSNSALESGTEIGYSAYASMKGAMLVLTRYLAKELGPRGIRVNAIAPGATRTRIGGDVFDRFPELIAPLAAKTVFNRIGEPDDIGKVVAFLASPNAAWITGQTIEASGGMGL